MLIKCCFNKLDSATHLFTEMSNEVVESIPAVNWAISYSFFHRNISNNCPKLDPLSGWISKHLLVANTDRNLK